MRGNFGQHTESGRWIRRGGQIVVLPAGGGGMDSPPGAALQGEVGGSARDYTVCDFIDPRIDVAAQYALAAMMKHPFERGVARGMFAALHGGRLGGIYQEDQRVPALRAQRQGTGWWTLIPAGLRSACVRGSVGEPPIVVFRRSLAKDPAGLRSALVDAWFACRIPTLGLRLPPPSGRPCDRPPPKPPVDGGGPPAGMPVIELSHVRPGWELPEGSTRPMTHQLEIRNRGTGTLAWNASNVGSWLSVSPTSGTIPPGGSSPLFVTANPAGLRRGRFEADFTITSPRAANSPQQGTAILIITPP